ncbi:MAG: Asp-tRNA(Asn)/Glu-tRNA(Gln) amidotransferase subunit GatB [Bacilli bacterium]
MNKLIPTIGLEVHLELKTKTKVFSNAINNYGSTPNTLVNEIDLGYPGVLPTVNYEVVKLAIKAAYLLNCKISNLMHFDRKNYFYSDNSKGYQITQNETPIGRDGYIEIMLDKGPKKIRIERIHIEEDTAKSMHNKGRTLLDFNRAGVPLVEIVTHPDIESAQEAVLYLEKLKELMYYANISDCKIEEGSMRCDANVSLKEKDSQILGTKCEIKNIGSINNVGIAINAEILRQQELIDQDKKVIEQTRKLDEKTSTTILLRNKETGNDYRYFPEPDIPFINLEESFIKEVLIELPIMPNTRRQIWQENNISSINIEKLIQNRSLGDYLLGFKDINYLLASNLLLGEISAYLNKTNKLITETKLTPNKFIKLLELLDKKEINNQIFKENVQLLLESDLITEEIFKDCKIKSLSVEELKTIIELVIKNNLNSVQDYSKNKDRTLKYLMGQVMKNTKGLGDRELILKYLEESLSSN